MAADTKRTNKVSLFFSDSEFMALSREALVEDRAVPDLVRRRVLMSMYGSIGARSADRQRKLLSVDDSDDQPQSGFGE